MGARKRILLNNRGMLILKTERKTLEYSRSINHLTAITAAEKRIDGHAVDRTEDKVQPDGKVKDNLPITL